MADTIAQVTYQSGLRTDCNLTNHRACAARLAPVVEVLLKHHADVNARDKNWQTPFHVAAANNAVDCVQLLIPKLNNINITDRAGRSSLHHGSYAGHADVVEILINAGANGKLV